mgnify:CR=1 FL=1
MAAPGKNTAPPVRVSWMVWGLGASFYLMAFFQREPDEATYLNGRPELRSCAGIGRIVQYEQTDDGRYTIVLQGVSRALWKGYQQITPRYIAGHSDIAPERKTDPGPAFDWLRLYDGLRPTK